MLLPAHSSTWSSSSSDATERSISWWSVTYKRLWKTLRNWCVYLVGITKHKFSHCRGWVVTFISQQKSSGPNHVTKSSGSKKMLRHAIFNGFLITALELIRKLDGCPSKMSEKYLGIQLRCLNKYHSNNSYECLYVPLIFIGAQTRWFGYPRVAVLGTPSHIEFIARN